MSTLLDATGRQMDPVLTPKQNLALHQQARQLIQQGLAQVAQESQIQAYRQGLFLEFLVTKLQGLLPELFNTPEEFSQEFETWAEERHKQLSEENARAEEERDIELAKQLLQQGTPIELVD